MLERLGTVLAVTRVLLATGGLAGIAVLAWLGAGVWAEHRGATRAHATIERYCLDCHNAVELAGDIDFAAIDMRAVDRNLPFWEAVSRKLRAGEMPPPDRAARPDPADIATLASWVEASIDRAYDALPRDPGRVTARRLNRTEYELTIRDLLGVDFAASDAFPADDTVLGFDNNADVLTVSPTLMQQYLTAAETVAARAVGGGPLPEQAGFFSRPDRIRRIDANSIELTEVLDYDADYLIHLKLVGNRGNDDPPVTVVISVDGEPVREVTVPVQKSQVNIQGGATQRQSVEARVFLTAAKHTIRADFVDDAFVETLAPGDYRNNDRNIYPDVIEIAGPYAAEDPPRVDKPILTCDPASGPACIESIMSDLVYRAYRRPVTRAEVAPYLEIYDEASALDYSPREALQFSIAAVLVSPEFLLRREADPRPGEIAEISDFELASRLSYFLWSSMPDAELFALAEQGKLQDEAVIRSEVERMLDDPKAAALSEHFVGQWLETRSLDAVSRDSDRFPEWDGELARAMAKETELFFASVLEHDRPISDFIDGPYTYVNERLADHYGLDGVEGEHFRRVDLDGNAERGGVFTQASVLTVTSYPNRTSVVLRGKYLLDNVLRAPPPGPPADVPGLDEAAVGAETTLRGQMEAHRTNPTCASCHVRMDPLGFGLENYDATGKWRTMDGNFAIDASGELPNGRRFDGPAELKALLGESLPDFAGALAEKLMTYALGRGVESAYDRKVLRDIVRTTAAEDDRLRVMIAAVATSVPFRERRAETPSAEAAFEP